MRVLNGFAASIDPRLLPALERDPWCRASFPVRAAYPAAVPDSGSILETDVFAAGSGRRPEVALPGVDGSGVTIALLDTGVDTRHPFLQGRLLPGLDMVDPGSDASAEQNPTSPGAPSGTAPSSQGSWSVCAGPRGSTASRPGAMVLPIRVAGWQPDADGGVSVYGRTDQVLAGLEAAVDPNADGDAHDAVRIALVGVVEPFASFPDAPLATAAAGALALDTLVVAPAGTTGPQGRATAASPHRPERRARSASRRPTRGGGARPCTSSCGPGCGCSPPARPRSGGAAPPTGVVTAPVAALPRRQVVAVTEGNALDPLFDDTGYSRVAGTAALLPTGPTTPEVVRELAAAGVRAVLVDGPIPAGSLGVDEPVEVPIVGVPSATAAEVRAALAAGVPVELSVGAAAFDENPELRAVAPFSSTGLALDGGARPELAAPGVGLVTSVPGRSEGGAARYGTISGSSAAAAVVAGAAALLADARPDLDAGGLRGALSATVRRVGGAGTGRARRPRGRIRGRARRRPAGRGARRPRRSGHPGDGHRDAAQRLAQAPRRPAAARVGHDRRDRDHEPRARRAPARRVAHRLDHGRGRRAPGRAGRAHRRRARIRPAGPRLRIPWSVAVPVTRLPVVSRVRLSAAVVPCERHAPGRARVRRRPCRRDAGAAAAPAAGAARRRAVPRLATGGAARASPRRAARPLRVRPHGTRPGGCAPAARRVRRPDRRDAGGRRPADERRRLLPPR